MKMREQPLGGGRVTPGVVRVGETVHRPRGPNWEFVRALLTHLEQQGFEATPRYVGSDEQGREVLSFLPGTVPPDLDPALPDETLAAAARLIRRFHDATAAAVISQGHETVCHGDLSPCNFVFRDGEPVGMIDFDAAGPGERLRDVGYALFLWLNLGTDGPPLAEQARRTNVFCRAYGIDADQAVIDAIVAAVAANIERLCTAGRLADLDWWEQQRDWLMRRQHELAGALASP
jgi:Ser/Thr protein kinase RdoA (MazF antagonist)